MIYVYTNMFFVWCVYYNFDIYTHTHLKECPRVWLTQLPWKRLFGSNSRLGRLCQHVCFCMSEEDYSKMDWNHFTQTLCSHQLHHFCAELCWGAKAALAGQTGKKRKARGQDVVSGAVRSSWKKNLRIVTSRKERWSTQKITKVGGCFEEGSERWLWPGSCANQAADYGGGEIVAGRS